jgi:hypothetical protein
MYELLYFKTILDIHFKIGILFTLCFQVKSQVDTLYFWDGLRKIDIVLAFEEGQEDKEEVIVTMS